MSRTRENAQSRLGVWAGVRVMGGYPTGIGRVHAWSRRKHAIRSPDCDCAACKVSNYALKVSFMNECCVAVAFAVFELRGVH